MNTAIYRFDGEKPYKTGTVAPGDTRLMDDKDRAKKRLYKNRQAIAALQTALYAEGEQSLLVILQAMDAAGKDGTIRHVFTGVNPQGVQVTGFKQPSGAELARDFLWRVHQAVPPRGYIGIFNRSHYEDVLAGRVLDLPTREAMPAYAREDIWKRRYRQISDFERMLHENGTTVVKLYLNLSRQEQTRRFLARAKDPAKRWKFSQGDLDTSGQWDAYMDAYEQAINGTAAAHAPWYVLPADHKWYTRMVVSEIVLEALRKMAPRYPKASAEQLDEIAAFRASMDKRGRNPAILREQLEFAKNPIKPAENRL